MSDVQKLVLAGKIYYFLTEEFYEDLIDSRRAEAISARIRAGGEELWPLTLVQELLETDSSIRTLRKYRGMTISELAEAAGLSQPYVSEIETGKKTGSVDALRRIAVALKVDLDDLIP